jgi:hypothetical protein
VPIQRRDVAAMLNNDRIAIAILFTAKDHFPIACRLDWRTAWRRVIDTTMRPNRVQDRMFAARIETGKPGILFPIAKYNRGRQRYVALRQANVGNTRGERNGAPELRTTQREISQSTCSRRSRIEAKGVQWKRN